MKLCTKCGKHEAMPNNSHCSPCRASYLREYRARVRASVNGPHPWLPDPLNVVFRDWLQQ